MQRIQTQMKMSLALQQLEYVQTKYEQVGRREMLGMFFRMMAPVLYQQISAINNWPMGAALGFVLMSVSLGLSVLSALLLREVPYQG